MRSSRLLEHVSHFFFLRVCAAHVVPANNRQLSHRILGFDFGGLYLSREKRSGSNGPAGEDHREKEVQIDPEPGVMRSVSLVCFETQTRSTFKLRTSGRPIKCPHPTLLCIPEALRHRLCGFDSAFRL